MPKAFLKSGFFKAHAHAVNYVEYINKQSPLFTGSGDVSLSAALGQLDACGKSIKWRHVFSLRGEDAQRLSVDRAYLQRVVSAQKDKWAKAHNISPENLVVLASFHEVTAHPHMHMVMFSTNPREGYILAAANKTWGETFKRARETTKSTIANEIFKNDLHELKVTKAQQRTQMNKELQMLLQGIGKSTHAVPPGLTQKMAALSAALAQQPGKHQYGYLPPSLKEQVSEILRIAVESDREVNALFKQYAASQEALVETYVDSEITKAEKMEQWEKAFFTPAKGEDTARHNIILATADNLSGVERYREEKAFSALDDGAAQVSDDFDYTPAEAMPDAQAVPTEIAQKPQPPPAAPKSDALLNAEYEMKAVAERYLRGKISSSFAQKMSALEIKPLPYARQSAETKTMLHTLVLQLVQTEAPEAGAPLEKIHQETAPHMAYSDFMQRYLHAQPLAPTESAAQTIGADITENPTPLHQLLLEYAPHFHGRQTADLRTIQREKDVRALRMQLVRLLDKNMCSVLNSDDGAWKALALRVEKAKPVVLQDGTVLPKVYRTVGKPEQKEIETLVRACWTDECTAFVEAMADAENVPSSLREFTDTLIAPPKGKAATIPNLAVRHLLQYAARASSIEQQPFYPERTQVAKQAAKPAEETLTEPTEADRLAAWRVRCAIEKNIMEHPDAFGAHLLSLHEKINFQNGAVPYTALSQTEQNAVNAFLPVVLQQRAVQAELNAAYKAQTEHRAGVQAYTAALFADSRADALRTLVLEYAHAATPQAPVALNVPQRREARREIERAVDRLVCAALNSNAPSELRTALLETSRRVLAPAELKGQDKPETLLSYGSLQAAQKKYINEQLAQLLQIHSVQQAIVSMLWQCGEKGTAQQWVQNTVNPLKNNGARLQNLLLHHLELHRLEQENTNTPHERLTKDANVYRDKTPLMALTGMLYAIGATMRDDTRRVQNNMPPHHAHKKIRAKKIEKQQPIANEPIQH